MTQDDRTRKIDQIRTRLNELATERSALEQELSGLLLSTTNAALSAKAKTATERTQPLSSVDKIALFQQLFAGRKDVFPLRWENSRDGRSGYAPACANEWKRGICGKPQVKCGECPNQSFIPLSADIIEGHLHAVWSRTPPC